MLNSQYDPRREYEYVRYGRMSNPGQNPTSPDQQFDTVQRVRLRCGYDHWRHLADYRDDGVSGRLMRKRPGFQKMLFDIKSGVVRPDLILVDDIDRFGRMSEMTQLRRELYNKYGVLVLDAKSNFADPHGAQGRIYNTIEELRATEEGRTKARRVVRGKRDAVRQRRWPGGPPPFGYRLKTQIEDRNGRPKHYGILTPNSETAWVLQLAFRIADEKGWGQGRVARYLNNHADIPDDFKPFQAATVGNWFENEVYSGVMVWPKVTTDIVDDCRVIEAVSEEEQIRVEDYCESIIPRDLFDRVLRIRRARGKARKSAIADSEQDSGKQLKAPVPGLSLKYLLAGLVRCGHCKRAMIPNGSGAYTTKDGQVRRYAGYACPGAVDGDCPNRKRIPEEWLREVVVSTIRERLFPVA